MTTEWGKSRNTFPFIFPPPSPFKKRGRDWKISVKSVFLMFVYISIIKFIINKILCEFKTKINQILTNYIQRKTLGLELLLKYMSKIKNLNDFSLKYVSRSFHISILISIREQEFVSIPILKSVTISLPNEVNIFFSIKNKYYALISNFKPDCCDPLFSLEVLG